MKSLVFLFLAYNLFLGAILVDVLTATGTSTQTTTSFSDSDFGIPTPPPSSPVRISKPFYEAGGAVLSFIFEQYAVNNVTQLTIGATDCGACDMAIVALPLSPPPTIAKNGTLLANVGATYDVNRTDYYVLIYDTRAPLYPCEGQTNCTVRLSGTVSASTPVGPSPYSNLAPALTILGILAIIPPIYWTLQKQRRTKTSS